MTTCIVILATALLCFKGTRFIGYILAIIAWELNSKTLGYTETELCLNDIIIILLFILYEMWNMNLGKENKK